MRRQLLVQEHTFPRIQRPRPRPLPYPHLQGSLPFQGFLNTLLCPRKNRKGVVLGSPALRATEDLQLISGEAEPSPLPAPANALELGTVPLLHGETEAQRGTTLPSLSKLRCSYTVNSAGCATHILVILYHGPLCYSLVGILPAPESGQAWNPRLWTGRKVDVVKCPQVWTQVNYLTITSLS